MPPSHRPLPRLPGWRPGALRSGGPAAALLVAVPLALAVPPALSGCGYSLGYRAPPGVRSIAVPLFNNSTFPLRREIELELTDAVRKEVLARTGLELRPAAEADMVLHGNIVDFRDRVAAEGRADEKIESTIAITVALVVEDYSSGRRWEERLTVQEPLSIQRGETLEEAVRRAIGNLAERILLTVESWEEG